MGDYFQRGCPHHAQPTVQPYEVPCGIRKAVPRKGVTTKSNRKHGLLSVPMYTMHPLASSSQATREATSCSPIADLISLTLGAPLGHEAMT